MDPSTTAATNAAAPSRAPPATAPGEPALLDVLGLLWRHKMLILATMTLTMTLSALIVFQLTPRYTAEAQILIGTRTAKVVDVESVLEALRPDRATVQNEVEVLASRSLAEAVVDELGLVESPEFNRRLRPPSLLRDSPHWLAQWLRAALSGDDPTTAPTPEEEARSARDDTVTALSDALEIAPVRLSNVVSVAASSEDAELAATIVNTLSDVYLRQLLAEKFAATERAGGWLDERVRELREQVEQSERRVEDYRNAQGLTQTSDSTLIEQQISEVNSQLIAARATTSEADAKLRQARELMQSEDGIYTAPEVLAAPLIQSLRMQEASLVGEAAQMAQEYGPRHPRMINVNAELKDIRTEILDEVQRIVRSLENGLEVARTRERSLEAALEELTAQAERLTASQARLRVLEREAAANQALFDMFLARQMETGGQEDLFSADARILSRATTPNEQTWPNVVAAMGISLVVSALLALLMVFVVEQVFNRGFRHSGQLEAGLRVGSLGVVPMLADKEEDALISHVLNNPMSAFSESLRMLHVGLLATRSDDSRPVSVLVTSSVANEGKTFLAIALARLIARSGRRTLLIDADLRHGQIAKRLALPDRTGLAHLLAGRAEITNPVIQRDEESGLDVLTAGKSLKVRTDIVRARQMAKILAEFKDRYELVIVDSPPVLLVSDALTLGQIVDDTVYCVLWADTPRQVAAAGVKQLLDAGARVAGGALTMAQGHRKRYYSYNYGSYGYGPEPYGLSSKYSRYYSR